MDIIIVIIIWIVNAASRSWHWRGSQIGIILSMSYILSPILYLGGSSLLSFFMAFYV